MSFAILIEKVVPFSELEKFCDYFAQITGFLSREEMFKDSDYMENVALFSQKMKASAVNRNNASHGGTIISVEQCKIDKNIVLSGIKSVRNDSLGLIQQLIYLMNRTSK